MDLRTVPHSQLIASALQFCLLSFLFYAPAKPNRTEHISIIGLSMEIVKAGFSMGYVPFCFPNENNLSTARVLFTPQCGDDEPAQA